MHVILYLGCSVHNNVCNCASGGFVNMYVCLRQYKCVFVHDACHRFALCSMDPFIVFLLRGVFYFLCCSRPVAYCVRAVVHVARVVRSTLP